MKSSTNTRSNVNLSKHRFADDPVNPRNQYLCDTLDSLKWCYGPMPTVVHMDAEELAKAKRRILGEIIALMGDTGISLGVGQN